ncbi:MAG: HAMP domain-containing protein [Proteobacteria bacterium]|nr:HAMP domain-containing protein [Pseudomonadota bacterium]
MRTLIPGSIAGRTVLVLLAGLTLSHALSTLIHTSDRADVLSVLGGSQLAERIATVTRLVAEAAPAERARLTAAASGPTLKVRVGRESTIAEDADSTWRGRLMEETIKLYLGEIPTRALRVAFVDRAARGHYFGDHPPFTLLGGPVEMMHSHMRWVATESAFGHGLRVAVQIADGTWLDFDAPLASYASFWSGRALLSLAVMILAVVMLSLWAVRRTTAPLVAFARAAERFGRDVSAPPWPEEGPSEVRQAARAFNEMQGRLRRFVEDRTQMVAAISHDLRTPITRMRLRAEFVEDEAERAKMLADLDEMERMVTSTLSFAREDATEEPLERVDLAALVGTICDEMVDAGRPVRCDTGARIPFDCHPIALKRALANLIDNAVKYGGRADVAVAVDRDGARVVVTDDGPGIPGEKLEHVFRPFYRVEVSRSRETGGVGLGLTIARTVIHAHGGEIALSNRPEGGLRVEVTLPR